MAPQPAKANATPRGARSRTPWSAAWPMLMALPLAAQTLSDAPGVPAGSAVAGQGLPATVAQALARTPVPAEALAVVVRDPATGQDRLRLHGQRPMNPASVIKLVTTYAALDLLGPSWTWKTPVWFEGTVHEPGPEGVLQGHLHIKGTGDPKLNQERIWALLQRIRLSGVREIRGDIVLDQSAFGEPAEQPGDFDGEPLRPYNVQPRALMLNQRSVIYHFVPDAARGVARVLAEPELAGVRVEPTVPLSPGPCEDWRAALKPQWQDPTSVRWTGRFPAACGERQWPVAHPEPQHYDRRLLQALWGSIGGRLTGTVREGPAPARAPNFEWSSPPLAEVVRDINKFSNNTMAQQLALTLALQPSAMPVNADQARAVLQRWADARLPTPGLRLVNGSGLSRDQRITAEQVATLLQQAWTSPVLPDLMASLPVAGSADGTLRRLQHMAGRAHLKTGSLRDVVAVAGYVLGRSGRRWIVVAIIHHDQAAQARAAIDALVQWTLDDGPPAPAIKASRLRGSPESPYRP